MPEMKMNEEQLLEYIDECIETHREFKENIDKGMLGIDTSGERIKIETLQSIRMAVFGEEKE